MQTVQDAIKARDEALARIKAFRQIANSPASSYMSTLYRVYPNAEHYSQAWQMFLKDLDEVIDCLQDCHLIRL